jgi:bifunctional non-homologous end joining protein LigD
VQKHAARRLHYDFRLEMDGVLKSWAVPKGFPARKGDKRLAVEVEDHPFEYGGFEGTIPPGNYGAGTVMLWDRGTYAVYGGEPLRGLREGKLHMELRGRKLKGEWTLVRMKGTEGDKPQWLLLKSGEDVPPISSRAEDKSVLTGRSLKQIAETEGEEWVSNRAPTGGGSKARGGGLRKKDGREDAKDSTAGNSPGLELKRLPRAKADFVEPMKALPVDNLPKGPQWLYEIKFDGVRALAIKTQAGIHLVSRNRKELNSRYPEVVEALSKLPVGEAVLDGEVVAVDEQGRSSFQLLQTAQMRGHQRPLLFYYVFDVLNLEGRDLTGLPLYQRKATAQSLLRGENSAVRFSSGIKADSARLMREMQARGLEGVVAKKKDCPYQPGRRSGAWVKFKWRQQQEFVIGGYTEPQGARSYFGAILVGYYERGKVFFAAKVGTGFDERMLKDLYLRFQKLRQPGCPFDNLPEKPGLHSAELTRAEMRRCTWVEPRLVCEVRFAEWTRDGHLRQPAFLGLREDKEPNEVRRERVASTAGESR